MTSKTYLAFDGKHYKIGTSTNPKARIANIKSLNPTIELIHFSDSGTVESMLHRLYEKYRVEGTREWYKFSKKQVKEVIYYINNEYDETISDNPLKARVHKAKIRLEIVGVKSATHYFCRKYPEYKDNKDKPSNRLKNLWYEKITDADFTNKIEDFASYMESSLKEDI